MNRIWESKNSLPGVIVLAALAVARPPMAFAAVQPSLQVVPQPREVRAAGAGFEPAKARFICVSAGAADRFTARLLQEALRETHGVDGNVVLLLPQKMFRPTR